MIVFESEVKTRWQSAFSVLALVFARLGISALTWAMHLVKLGGSLGTITG